MANGKKTTVISVKNVTEIIRKFLKDIWLAASGVTEKKLLVDEARLL
jgi:hypothetical protein